MALVLAITGSAAQADTVLYSTGFEGPTFTPGPLAGQDGWSEFPAASAAVQVTNAGGNPGQALAVLPALAAGQDGPYKTVNTAATVVRQSADIFLASSSIQSGWQYAAVGAGLAGFAGGIDVSPDGTINLITFGFTNAGTWALDQWVRVVLTLNYATQLYDISIGASLFQNIAFCGDNGPCLGAPVTAYSNGFFDTFPSSEANDIGFLDNYSVTAVSETPIPAALPLFASGLAGFGMLGWRRKRKTMAA